MKRITCILIISFSILLIGMPINKVNAEELLYYSVKVPDEMQPNSEIEFVDDTHYVIKKGGNVSVPAEIKKSQESIDKTNQAKKDGSYYTAFHMDSYDAVAGLKVYYAADGFLKDLVYPDGIENPLDIEQVSPNLNLRSITPRGPGPNDTLLYQWGAHQNQVWQVGNTSGRFGSGRATSYNDRLGQRDNVLKKGDIALSLSYDNCAFGTVVEVNAPIKGSSVRHFQTMYKRDAGRLPDAVMDIWKDGVQYWGYEYSSTCSIDFAQYIH